jgi:hypothetical protein
MSIGEVLTIKETAASIRSGVTRTYELIGRGDLIAIKSGRRTLVTRASRDAYLESLPRADIRTGRNQQRGG